METPRALVWCSRLAALIIRLHRAYCRRGYVPIAWTLLIVTMVLQVLLVALARP